MFKVFLLDVGNKRLIPVDPNPYADAQEAGKAAEILKKVWSPVPLHVLAVHAPDSVVNVVAGKS